MPHASAEAKEDALVREWLPYALRIAERRFGSTLTEDVASDAALALLLALRRHDPARRVEMRKYLALTIPRLLVDLHRERRGRSGTKRNAARAVPLSDDVVQAGLSPAGLTELRDEVRHALRGLGRREAMVLWLCLGEEQEQRQVAARLGVRPSRISQIVQSALAEARAQGACRP